MLLNVADVAKRLNLSEDRVRKICRSGRLGQKIGRDWVISEEELEVFMKIPRKRGRPRKDSEPS